MLLCEPGQSQEPKAQMIFGRFWILFDQPTLLQSAQKPIDGALVKARQLAQLGYTQFVFCLVEGLQDCHRSGNRAGDRTMFFLFSHCDSHRLCWPQKPGFRRLFRIAKQILTDEIIPHLELFVKLWFGGQSQPLLSARGTDPSLWTCTRA